MKILNMKSTKRKTRAWCEDSSLTIKKIKLSKHNGDLIIIGKNEYERIGDDLLYNKKTSRIEKFVL
jgi:hypothetical protein